MKESNRKILEFNDLFIKFYLKKDYRKMQSALLLLNHWVDLAIKEKRNESKTI